MTGTLRLPVEKVALGVALALAVAGGAWWWMQQPRLDALRRQSAATPLLGGAYARAEFPTPAPVAKTWPKPKSQSHGGGWVYEVFTPPVIYYHEGAKSFAVTPPLQQGESQLAFGVELIDIQRELYRLQLVGYVGSPGDYVAAFVSPKLPETLLARSGKRFDDLGLALASVDVRKINVSDDPAMPAYDVAAIATLRDLRTGAEVTLDSRERKFTDTPLALLRLGNAPKPREVRVGDVLQDTEATYRVERISLDPPEVVVAKSVNGLPYPETRVLKPTTPAKLAKKTPPPAERFQPKSERGVATSENRR